MAMYTSLHLDPDEQVDITCEHRLNGSRPEGYPVLCIGDLSIYPTRERLERLVAVCSAYLAAHGDKAEGFQVGYPSDVRCDHCGNPTVAFQGHRRCFGCGNSMPLTADGPAETPESIYIEDLRSDLTEAAIEVGIDPDGMDDGAVIRALVRRTHDEMRRDLREGVL